MGVALGHALRRAALAVADRSAPAQARLAEHHAVLEWKRRRGGVRRPLPRGTRAWTGGAAWSGAAAWAVKDLRVAARQRGLRTKWILVLLAKGAALAWVLAARGDTPWVLAGLLLVLSDALAGEALLQHWYHEQPGWVWAAPAPRRAQWAARALPAAALSLAASLTLAATAWAQAGAQVAQPLALWTVAAGLSLVLAAANLGAAAPPRSPLGQNLYGLGLTTALLIGAVFPVVGWVVLAVFALYTFRSLGRDSRP